jgi:sulfur-carrier protein
MARLVLFAAAREAAGTRHAVFDASTVGGVLDQAVVVFGEHFAAVLTHSKIWCNGEPADRADPAGADDEIAVLPPVSGG